MVLSYIANLRVNTYPNNVTKCHPHQICRGLYKYYPGGVTSIIIGYRYYGYYITC